MFTNWRSRWSVFLIFEFSRNSSLKIENFDFPFNWKKGKKKMRGRIHFMREGKMIQYRLSTSAFDFPDCPSTFWNSFNFDLKLLTYSSTPIGSSLRNVYSIQIGVRRIFGWWKTFWIYILEGHLGSLITHHLFFSLYDATINNKNFGKNIIVILNSLQCSCRIWVISKNSEPSFVRTA